MSNHQPSRQRPLNTKQLAILHLLYRFRFATTDLFAKSLGKKDKSEMNRRLKVLKDQEYIGRKYQPDYHLQGKHASFHLLTRGIQALRGLSDAKYAPTVLHSIHKDKTAAERFINHWLGVFSIYCQLKARYGDRLRIFTTSELSQYEYFPAPLPDLYIRLDSGDKEKQFFIDLLDISQPLFIHLKRVKQYIEYTEEGDWEDATGTELPAIILVCESESLKSRLLRLVRRGDVDLDDDLALEVTTKENLGDILDAKKKARQS